MNSPQAKPPTIDFDEFLAVDIRVGRVTSAELNDAARKPAIKLWVDFGPDVGVLKTSAQITRHYDPATLPGRLVAGVVNFPAKQIGNFMSQCLVLGFPDDDGEVVLVTPDRDVPIGGRLF